MAEPIPMRRHQHFKSPEKKYVVLAVGNDVDPPYTERVSYMPLYGENAGKVLFRVKAEWESEVANRLDDLGAPYSGPRFWPLPHEPPSFTVSP